MAPVNTNIQFGRTLRVTLLFVVIAAFVAGTVGFATVRVRRDISYLSDFLSVTQDLKSNFEKSLVLYAASTKDEIAYLLKLRPASEEEIVKFISSVEEIAQNLDLEIDLQSVQVAERGKVAPKGVISYRVGFFGTFESLVKFLSAVERLPYYVAVKTVDFKDLKYVDVDDKKNPNVVVLMTLFIK